MRSRVSRPCFFTRNAMTFSIDAPRVILMTVDAAGRGATTEAAPRTALARIWIADRHRGARFGERRLGEPGPFPVVPRAGAADWFEDVGRSQVAQVALRLLEVESLCVLVAQAADSRLHSHTVQREDNVLVLQAADSPGHGHIVQRRDNALAHPLVVGEIRQQPPDLARPVHPVPDG